MAAVPTRPSVSMIFPASPSSSQCVVSPPGPSTSYCVSMASPTTSHPFISSEESSEDDFSQGQIKKLPRCQHRPRNTGRSQGRSRGMGGRRGGHASLSAAGLSASALGPSSVRSTSVDVPVGTGPEPHHFAASVCGNTPRARPWIDVCQQKLSPSIIHQECTIDEAMIPSKGRLAFKQYIKAKPTKWGIKVFVLAEATNGYIRTFQIYTGRSLEDGNSSVDLCTKVVLDLMSGLEGSGLHMNTVNYYT